MIFNVYSWTLYWIAFNYLLDDLKIKAAMAQVEMVQFELWRAATS